MDCQKFELIVTDFARESLTDARTLKSAILHAEICPPCARRVAHERRLTAVLQTIAADGVNESAPAHVETNLLDAFRARHAKQSAAATSALKIAQTAKVIQFVSHQARAPRNSWKRAAIGAALAACFALVCVTALRAWRTTSNPTTTQQAANNKSESALKTQRISVDTTPRTVADEPKNNLVKTSSTMPERIVKNDRSHRVFASNLSNRTPRANTSHDDTAATNTTGTDEIATDFLTLTPTTSDALEGGQIVRVELPHSALATFGLPFNADRANEKVKADVVLSADGVARAIRFVR